MNMKEIRERIADYAARTRDQTKKLDDFVYMTESVGFADPTNDQPGWFTRKEKKEGEDESFERIQFSDTAQRQLLTILEPALPKYFNHLPSASLRAINVNYWLEGKKEKEVLLRWADDRVRGVLTTRFSKIDDILVAPVLQKALEAGEAELGVPSLRFSKTDEFTFFLAEFKRLTSSPSRRGKRFSCGLMVTNSEIGQGALRIEPVIIYRGVESWLNGLPISTKLRSRSFRHIGSVTESNVADAIRWALKVAQVGLGEALLAEEEKLRHPLEEELDLLIGTRAMIPNLVKTVIKRRWGSCQDVTKLDLALEVLHCIEHLPEFKHLTRQRKVDISQEMGAYLGIFRSTPASLVKRVYNLKQKKQKRENNK